MVRPQSCEIIGFHTSPDHPGSVAAGLCCSVQLAWDAVVSQWVCG